MVKKNQLRKKTIQQIIDLISQETDGDNLQIYTEIISDKNKILEEKKQALLFDFQSIRKSTQKIVRQLNGGVKDRLEKKSKLVMDRKSRPTNEEMKEMANLFTYMENQNNLISCNDALIDKIATECSNKNSDLTNKTSQRKTGQCQELDRQYNQLHQQCQKQEIVKTDLITERDKYREFYKNIEKEIESCRTAYDKVEAEIRIKQIDLIHLTTYLETRKEEDNEKIVQLQQMTFFLQSQILKNQTVINLQKGKNEGLFIKEIETYGTL